MPNPSSLRSRALLFIAVCGCATEEAAPPLLSEAQAQLVEFRPRTTVGPAELDARDLSAQTAWWPITAEASFRTTREGVDLTMHLQGCRVPYSYPVSIYPGSDCSAIQRDSQPWDGARGTLEMKAFCLGSGGARLHLSRANTHAKPWSLGGSAASDLIGRTIAVLDPDTHEPLICGRVSVAADGGVPWAAPSPSQRPQNAVVEQLAGLCLLDATPRTADSQPGCPNVDTLTDCAFTHCIAQCLDQCAEYTACLQASGERCTAACPPNEACDKCLATSIQCTLGFCPDELACTPPTPGGPCTELRQCCERQGPLVESCMTYADTMERLGGDPSCLGALWDWDFNTNYVYRSPCTPEGAVPMP